MLTVFAASCVLGSGGLTWTDLSTDLQETNSQTGRFVMESGRVLLLEQFEVRSPNSEVVVMNSAGPSPVDLGGLRLWHGVVQGEEDSGVYVAVSSHFTNGFVRVNGEIEIVSSGGLPGDVWATDVADLPASIFEIPECEIRTTDGRPPQPHQVSEDGRSGDGPPCRVAMLALDTDWEFTERIFGGDTNAAAAYSLSLAGAISEIYVENVNVRLQVAYLRVWSSDIDPYDPTSGTDMLDQFRNEWVANMGHISRNIAHILTGRENLPYGGVAWLSVICNHNHGYGVSGYLNGHFPYPLEDNHGDNWDLVVMAHELGHNFGTLHTHDGYSPPIDNCGNGDCTGAENGTIMSYCHTCSGGITNIRLGFHDRVQQVILSYLDSIEPGCVLNAAAGTAVDDWAQVLTGDTIEIDVLLNDTASDCDGTFEPQIVDFDATSVEGGLVDLVAGDTSSEDLLAYTPPGGFDGEDSFTYELQTGAVATVYVSVEGLRAPDSPAAVEPGVYVNYYALSAPSVLPDFGAMTPYFDDVVSQINFASTSGAFATSGRSDEVGAAFDGYIEVAQDGLYTVSIDSDDGSRLTIGDNFVVDNDGLHGMVEVSGSIGLMTGKHRIRVEFFESGGGAGLIARIEGPGIPRQAIPASAWSHTVEDTGCGEDVNGDGIVGVDDLLGIIASWGPCGACDADVDGSGEVDVDDLLAVLSRWGQNC